MSSLKFTQKREEEEKKASTIVVCNYVKHMEQAMPIVGILSQKALHAWLTTSQWAIVIANGSASGHF